MGALIFGLLLALALCWAVGAHNRLMRLRADVVRQWSSVDAVWLRLLVRLQGGIAARQTLAPEQAAADLLALQTTCDELLEALSQVRLQPLDGESQKLLAVQHQKLLAEIRTQLQAENAAVRPDLDIALNRMRQTLPAALIPYHVAVVAYNEALAMRPASWLARQLNLKPVMRMDLSMGAA
jgi:LemA protein